MQTRKKYYIAFIKYFSNVCANLKYTIAMFLVTSRLGHAGLFISVVGKNTTWLDVSY